MSIEIATGQGHSYATDIWSCGCVLFEVCTGLKIFDAGDDDPTPLIIKGADENRLRRIRQGDDIIELVQKMLNKIQNDRISAQ